MRSFHHYIYLSLILFSSLFSHAQSDSSSYIRDTTEAYNYFTEAEQFHKTAEYDSAIQYYEKAASIYDRLELWENYVICLIGIGSTFNKSSQYEKSEIYYKKALSVGLSYLGEEHPTVATAYNDMAINSGRRGAYKEELAYLLKALSIYKKSYKGAHVDIAANFNNIAVHYYHQGNYDSTLVYMKKALAMNIDLRGEKAYSLAINYHNIGSVYGKTGNYKQQLIYLNKALDIYLITIGEMHPNVANTYEQIANCYMDKGEYKKVFRYLQKALAIYLETVGEMHENVVLNYNTTGYYYSRMSDYDQSLFYYDKALKIALELLGEEHFNTALTYNNIGECYGKKGDHKKQLNYLNKALNIRLKIFGEVHPNIGESYNNIAMTYGDLGDYDQQLLYLQKTLDIFSKFVGNQHHYVGLIFNNIGECYVKKGYYHKALQYHEKGLKIRLSTLGEEHPEVSKSYSNIAHCYSKIGTDYNKQLLYLKKALDISLKAFDGKHSQVGHQYNNIAMIYSEMGNYDKQLQYLKKTQDVWQEVFGEKHPNMAHLYNNIAACYAEKKEYDKSLIYYKKTLVIWSEILEDTHPNLAIIYNNLATHYSNKKDWNQAFTYLKKALELRQQLYEESHPEIAMGYNELGANYIYTKRYTEALKAFDKAIAILTNTDISLSMFGIPPLEKIKSRTELLEALHFKAIAFKKRSETQDSKTEDLQASLKNYQLAIALLDSIRANHSTESFKQDMNSEQLPLYQQTIWVAHKLHELNKDHSYWRQAFRSAEKSKAFTLSQALNESRAKQFAGLPDSLVEKEKYLKIDLAFYEEQLYKAKSKKDTARINMYQNYLFDRKVQYDSLVQQLEKNYPRYYQLKYDLQVASISDMQNYLPDTLTTFLEYTVADSAIFAFCIEKDTFQVYELPKPEGFEQKVQDFRKHVTEFGDFRFGTFKAQQRLFTEYVDLGYDLYQALLEPIVEGASLSLSMTAGEEKRRKLIIVPDGILGYLPFEALLTKRAPTDPIDFRNLPYLIRDFQTAYAYSGTLLLNNWKELEANPRKAARRFAGFAPVYESAPDTSEAYEPLSMMVRAGFTPLQHNKEEVQHISRLLGGHSYLGRAASEKSFKEKAGDYQVLHLAMHSLVDDKDPLYSRLIFTQSTDSLYRDSLNDNYLNAAELYNMQLNARLAVLSACETGYGQLIRGEGIMSLSRAFAYAGCPSLVMSLWNAEDQSTAQIMVDFYKQLRKEKPVDESLRQAKLRYLEEADHPYYQSHPFFWAAFVPVGEMEAIPLYDYSWLWWGVLLFPLIVLITWRQKIRRPWK